MRGRFAARLVSAGPALIWGLLVLGALAAAIWMLGLAGDEARGALAYDRTAVRQGEGYRILSAHLVHLNHDHVVWNLLGLLVLAFVLLDILHARGLILASVVSSLCVGFGLLWFSPDLHGYAGLSGVTHGLFAWGGLRLVQAGRRRYGGLVLAALCAKLLWEQVVGPMPGAEAAINAGVVIDAHLYGFVGGGLSWAIGWVGSRIRGSGSNAIAALVLSATVLAPDAAQAHRSAVTEARIGVADDGSVVLVIETHLAAFSLRRPFGPFDRDARDFLAQMSDEVLLDYVEGAAAFLISRIHLVDGDTRIAPVRIHYPTPDQVRAEGLHLDPFVRSEPIYLLFDPAHISPIRPVQLHLPALIGDYRLSVHPREGPVLVRFVSAGETTEPFVIDIPTPWYRRVMDYVVQGIAHVVPHGLDHTLFIAALALALPRLGPLVAQATVFTLAHSVTLALTVLGVIASSATLVETGIAVSIAAMGISNLATFVRGRQFTLSPWRLAVIFLFGLLHGMGFASVFGDLKLAADDLVLTLVSFNVGVEVGQILVLLVVLIAVRMIDGPAPGSRKSAREMAVYLRALGSALIALFGLWWTFERVGMAI